MKKQILFIGLFLSQLSFISRAATPQDQRLAQFNTTLYPHLAQFFETHPLPQNFAAALDTLRSDDELYSILKERIQSDKSTGLLAIVDGICIKKGDLSRIVHAKRMANCIWENHLDTHFGVTEKHFVHYKDDVWIILAQYVPNQIISEKFDLETVKKLIELTQKTGFFDWNFFATNNPSNWHCQNNKLVCIDTGQNSFTSDVAFALQLLHDLWEEHFTPEGLQIIKQAQDEAETLQTTSSLDLYDDPGNDFEKVLEEFRILRQIQ